MDRNDQTVRQQAVAGLREKLSHHLREDRLRHFGNVHEAWTRYAEEYFWDETGQDFRLLDLRSFGFLPGRSDILDLAAGCGQFLFRALDAGYNCHGIEPEQWKLDFIREKSELMGRPAEWPDRVVRGVGETIPFPDNSFDCVTSFQTLEHVQSPSRVIAEMVRVTRAGGGICLRCPDYRSFFEAHYQLPWLPLFPRPLARKYLQALNRPAAGLDSITYVTLPKVLRWVRLAEAGRRFQVIDGNRASFENALRMRGLHWASGIYPAYRLLRTIQGIGRRESDINVFIRILEK
jgi:ubiquinone/menaquinone biosynthesis C-methylase UbiE